MVFGILFDTIKLKHACTQMTQQFCKWIHSAPTELTRIFIEKILYKIHKVVIKINNKLEKNINCSIYIQWGNYVVTKNK